MSGALIAVLRNVRDAGRDGVGDRHAPRLIRSPSRRRIAFPSCGPVRIVSSLFVVSSVTPFAAFVAVGDRPQGPAVAGAPSSEMRVLSRPDRAQAACAFRRRSRRCYAQRLDPSRTSASRVRATVSSSPDAASARRGWGCYVDPVEPSRTPYVTRRVAVRVPRSHSSGRACADASSRVHRPFSILGAHRAGSSYGGQQPAQGDTGRRPVGDGSLRWMVDLTKTQGCLSRAAPERHYIAPVTSNVSKDWG